MRQATGESMTGTLLSLLSNYISLMHKKIYHWLPSLRSPRGSMVRMRRRTLSDSGQWEGEEGRSSTCQLSALSVTQICPADNCLCYNFYSAIMISPHFQQPRSWRKHQVGSITSFVNDFLRLVWRTAVILENDGRNDRNIRSHLQQPAEQTSHMTQWERDISRDALLHILHRYRVTSTTGTQTANQPQHPHTALSDGSGPYSSRRSFPRSLSRYCPSQVLVYHSIPGLLGHRGMKRYTLDNPSFCSWPGRCPIDRMNENTLSWIFEAGPLLLYLNYMGASG